MSDKGRKNKKTSSRKIKQHKAKHGSTAEKKTNSEISKIEKKQERTKPVSHKTISTRRLWVFRLISITIIPVLLFLFIEGVLRVVGYGFPSDIIIKAKVNDQDYYSSNPKFSWRFFPPKVARTCDPFDFPAEKSENTYRIFIMGASAAAGTPDDAFCFGRNLQVMLRKQYPQTNFEVITAAMPAINSHVVLQIAKDCAKHEADLFIVYLGNNEVVGPYGAGTVFSPLSSNLSLIRFGIAFKATKLGQLITNLLESEGIDDMPQYWRGMGMFLEKQVRADNENLKVVYKYFQRNLEDICHLAYKQKIPVILSTVTSNLKDSPPFASLHRSDLTETEKEDWEELYLRGIACEENDDYAEAAALYLEAAEIDNQYADLQFRLGLCYWAMGEYDTAKERFVQARELDTLRFRADNEINTVIRDVASDKTAERVYLVDADKVFEENSPYGVTGKELFYEHVHMNFNGNYLLAETIFRQVEKILPERITNYRTDENSSLNQAECARYLAYTDWEKFKIANEVLNAYLKKEPFTNQLFSNERIKQKQQQLKVLRANLSREILNEADSEYRWAIQQNPSDWWLHYKYGGFLEEHDNYSAAVKQYSLVIDYVPIHFGAYAKLGKLFGQMGDLEAAVTYNLKAVKIYPIFAEAYFNLGLAYHLQHMYDKAVESYSKAIQIEPAQAQSYNNLALILYEQGKQAEALEIYHKGLTFVPEDLDLHYNLGIMLRAQGRITEAIEELREALRIDPNSAKARKVLEETLKGAG